MELLLYYLNKMIFSLSWFYTIIYGSYLSLQYEKKTFTDLLQGPPRIENGIHCNEKIWQKYGKLVNVLAYCSDK